MSRPEFTTPTTPFPNWLLDEAMPALKDTEWRLLCVVVRQTLGWQDGPGQRKQRDWLTHSQLKRRTNRASAAVSAALDGLVRQGFIEVRGEDGILLSSPEDRRRARGRQFYQLSASHWDHGGEDFSESEIHKAKTTKENGTKEIEIPLSFSESELVGSVRGEASKLMEGESEPEKGCSSSRGEAAHRLVERYSRLYRHHMQREAPGHSLEEWASLCNRLSSHTPVELEGLLPAFFSCDLGYIRRRNHSLQAFLDTLSILQTISRTTRRDPNVCEAADRSLKS